MVKRLIFPFLLLVLTVMAGCAPSTNHLQIVEKNIHNRNYKAAIKVLKKNKKEYREKDQVVYQTEMGMLLHLDSQYQASNRLLQKAERVTEDLYTKSITDEAGSYFTNDNSLAYAGEDFERVMINIFGAVNYVFLGEWDEALVEARRVDHKLNVFNDKYKKKSVYKEDAFARYLSGILYEAQGEESDAFVAYRKAYDSYRSYEVDYGTSVPERLKADLLRVTKKLGLTEEYKLYRQAFSGTREIPENTHRNMGEVVFLGYNGLSPIKVEKPFTIRLPKPGGRGSYLMKIAFPKFHPRSNIIGHARVVLTGSKGVYFKDRTFEVEDIEAIAIKNLNDRIGRIQAKAIARASAKYLATAVAENQAKEQGGELAGLLVGLAGNVAAAATETIDQRSWRSLPATIHLSRMSVPPGTYNVTIEYYHKSGRKLETRAMGTIRVRSGKKTFLKSRYAL